MIGESGFKDIEETGLIRPKQNTKQDYQYTYFQKGSANSLYAKRGGGMYILEVPPCGKIVESECYYPRAETLDASTTPHRIWHRTEDGSYEIVKDSINDIITRNPDFRFKIII